MYETYTLYDNWLPLVCLLFRLFRQRCVRSASATACRAPALCAPAGCDFPASALWGTSWRTALMGHHELFMPTRGATVHLTEPTPDIWSLRTQRTSRHPPWTWSISRNHQTSAPTMARLAPWELPEGRATAPLQAWTDASCCAADVGSRLGLRAWPSVATAPSIGAVMSAAWTVRAHELCTSVYDLRRIFEWIGISKRKRTSSFIKMSWWLRKLLASRCFEVR